LQQTLKEYLTNLWKSAGVPNALSNDDGCRADMSDYEIDEESLGELLVQEIDRHIDQDI